MRPMDSVWPGPPAGITTKVFAERVSSIATRPRLVECLAYLREGDVLTVTKPDRLARSTGELLGIVVDLKAGGIDLVVLSMGGGPLDTRDPTATLMPTILAGVAIWEREIMLKRQREGIAKARAEGKYLGRKATIEAADVLALKAEGIGQAALAKRFGIAPSSVYRMLEPAA